MELINKIREYVQEVVQQEKGKKGDEHDYSHGKFAVAAVVERLIEEYDQPPKLRPMSELLEFKNLYGDFLVFDSMTHKREYEEFELKNGKFTLNPKDYDIEIRFDENWTCKDNEGSIFLGFIEKPNPNDIKI